MKKQFSFLLLVLFSFCLSLSVFAHSGNTDANGGHRDNNNVSGLGYYHYHHGKPAHLHPNGVCPYDAKETSPPNSLLSIVEKNSHIYSLSSEDYSSSNAAVSELKSKGSTNNAVTSKPEEDSTKEFSTMVIEWLLGTLLFGVIAYSCVVLFVETIEAIVKKSFNAMPVTEFVVEKGFTPCCIIVGLYLLFFVL